MSSRRTAQILAEISTPPVRAQDLPRRLVRACSRAVPVSGAGLVLSDERGRLDVVATTSSTTEALEVFELQIDQGPCLDRFRTGRAVVDVDLTRAQERWPDFARRRRGGAALHPRAADAAARAGDRRAPRSPCTRRSRACAPTRAAAARR
ncbi:hypothetical protein GTR00_15125 [Kineococcus sp. T90]|nr:hypothetical protein [Kineococcus indalonis]